MNLTRNQAIQESIKAWRELAERGCTKGYIVGLKKYLSGCPLCQYTTEQDGGREITHCLSCPLPGEGFVRCGDSDTPYMKWEQNDSVEDRKHYAHLFLEVLLNIPLGEEPVEEEWVNVTRECTVALENPNYGSTCIGLFYGGDWIAEFGLDGEPRLRDYKKGEYKLEQTARQLGANACYAFRVLKLARR